MDKVAFLISLDGIEGVPNIRSSEAPPQTDKA